MKNTKSILLDRLKLYMKREPMAAVLIAAELKFTDSHSVLNWLTRKSIPLSHQDALIRFLNEAERELTP